uniref:Bromo domain-containing protein n=1 Tax=Haemonchus placei TaxID=6290 RepID=A0A158QRX2_HAEPC
LALEYPGLPTGKRFTWQKGCKIIFHIFNLMESNRIFQLSHLLVDRSFAELSGEEKASILAFLCNELLCCPNIVKEIDRNLEEVGRLKGDRWMRDGKARALRVVQRKKQKAERGLHSSDTDGQAHDDRPPSRPATPIPTTRDRRLTPGLGQCEILTEEEENMSPDQLEVLIDSLNSEAEHLKEKINELSTKVRSFPLGCDRYHRQYWQIPGVPSILVESVESSGPWNPACNTEETCSKDPSDLTAPSFLHPDVLACVEDLVDDVVTGRSHTERRKRKRFRRMDNAYKRGWWENLEAVRSSLHGRGIRERILHRLLCKSWFLKDVKLGKGERQLEHNGSFHGQYGAELAPMWAEFPDHTTGNIPFYDCFRRRFNESFQSPPSREWFCPACVETSTQVPTCLVCSQQHDYLTACRLGPLSSQSMTEGTIKSSICFRAMLDELECQPGVGPFLEPVDLDLVPGYREVIANPIDMASIRNRIEAQCYETPEDFAADMELMFNNCRTFNEDDSPVGMAGANLHKFYHKRWRQLKYNFSKRFLFSHR